MRYFLPLLALGLAACGSNPPAPVKPAPSAAKSGGYYLDDGPPANPPPDLDAVPDAVPRNEPRHRYANRTYVALGKTYTPHNDRVAYSEVGTASWYGRRFHGRKTASGEPYDMYAMTAAHPTLPIPSYARVTALATGKSVVVRINDRGPFHSDRIIDLSYTAAHKLGFLGHGSARVRVERIDPEAGHPENGAPAREQFLQLGAFSSVDNARALLERVRAALGLSADRAHVIVADALHRVRIGPYASATAAHADRETVRARLDLDAVLVGQD